MSVYSAGWMLDNSGVAQLHELGATSVPSSAVYMKGFAFDSSGRLYTQAITTSVPATAVYAGGVARRPDGAAYVRYDTPSSTQFIAGNLVSSDGALCVSLTPDASPVFLRGINHKSNGRIVVAVGDYETSANDYDGTNDYQLRGAGLTGIADGKQGLFSSWVRIDGGDGNFRYILGSGPLGAHRMNCYFASDNKFWVVARNSSGTNILIMTSTTTYLAGAAWINVLASWNLSTGVAQMYVNDVDVRAGSPTVTDQNIDYDHTTPNWSHGALTDGTLKWNGCISETYFHTTHLDISVTENRRKFISSSGSPVFLGTNGSLPLGSQPLVYAPNGDLTSNKGSGGNFTTTGALDACSSSPSG